MAEAGRDGRAAPPAATASGAGATEPADGASAGEDMREASPAQADSAAAIGTSKRTRPQPPGTDTTLDPPGTARRGRTTSAAAAPRARSYARSAVAALFSSRSDQLDPLALCTMSRACEVDADAAFPFVMCSIWPLITPPRSISIWP